MQAKKIVIRPERNYYVAYFEGGQDRAESGRSVAEAVGALVVEQRSRLDLEISLVENFLDMKRWVNPCED
mgnify:CR=1 FL=1